MAQNCGTEQHPQPTHVASTLPSRASGVSPGQPKLSAAGQGTVSGSHHELRDQREEWRSEGRCVTTACRFGEKTQAQLWCCCCHPQCAILQTLLHPAAQDSLVRASQNVGWVFFLSFCQYWHSKLCKKSSNTLLGNIK